MAVKEITNTKLKVNEASAMPETTAMTSATDGCAVDYTGRDDGRILLIIENSGANAATAKILKGNGLQGTENLEISITAGTKMAVTVESGRFVNVSGTNKGKLIVNGGTGIKVAAIELP